MLVNNQAPINQLPISEGSADLKEGAVYKATIKEKISDNEAILQIRGKEQLAKFEDGAPVVGSRVTILVSEKNDQSINVKTIATENSKTTDTQQLTNDAKLLKSIGLTGKESPEVKQAVQILLDKGSPVSKEVVQDLKEFMDKAKGSIDSKIETVKALANKRLEATQPQLRAVHEALHGKPLNEVLTAIAKEIDPEHKLERNVTSDRPQEQIVQKAKETVTKVIEPIKAESKPLQPVSTSTKEVSELVRKSREMVENEPDLKKAIQQIKEEIVKNPKVDRDLAQKVEKAALEAEKLQSIGRDRLLQALKTAEEQLLRKEQPVQTNVAATQQKDIRLAQDVKLTDIVGQLKEEVSKSPNLQRSIENIKGQIIENPRFSKEVADKVQQAVTEAANLGKQGRVTTGREVLSRVLADVEKAVDQTSKQLNIESRPSEVVKEVKAEIQRDPNLNRILEKVRDQVINHPKMDREVAQKVEQAVKEAVQLQQIGKEAVGRDRIQQALAKGEVELKQIEARQPAQQSQVTQSDRNTIDSRQPVQSAQVSLLERNTVEVRPSEAVKEVKSELQRDPNLNRVLEKVRDQVINHPKMDREVAQKVEQALKEAVQLQQIGRESAGRDRLQQALAKAEVELKQIEARQPAQQSQVTQSDRNTVESRPSEAVKEVKAELQRDPNLNRVIEKVRDQVINHPKMDREVAQKVEQALRETVQLQQIGRESAGRDRLQQALAKAEVELKQIEARQPAQQSQVTQSDRNTVESRPSEAVKEVKAELQRDPNLNRVIEKVRDQVINHPKMDREVAQKVEQALRETVQLQQIGRESSGRDRLQQALAKAEVELKQIDARQPVQQSQVLQPDRNTIDSRQTVVQPAQVTQPDRNTAEARPSEAIKEVKSELQRDPNLNRVLEKVRDQVINHPKMDREVAQKVEQALRETVQLQQIGREAAGRDRLQQALAKVEVELKQIEARQPAQQPQPASDKVETVQKTTETQLPKQEAQMKESIQQIRDQIQTEPDPKKVLQKVQDLLADNKKIDPEITRNIERLANQANQLDQAGRDRLVKMLQQVEAVLKQQAGQTTENSSTTNQKEQQALNNAQQTTQTKNPELTEQVKVNEVRPSEAIKEALKQFQNEPNLEKALEQVRKEMSSNPNIDMKTIDRAEKALDHAAHLQDKGREMAARQHMTKELSEIEQELVKSEPKITQEPKLTPFDLNEQLQSLQIQSKDVLVTRVTQKLAQATHDFRELKREITRNLDNVHKLIETYKNNAYPQAKQMLETAISKLDNAILKSEMMLFTDMKTEKQLMQASSQLAEAKKLLAKGEHSEASKIVHDVKSLIDKLVFKPTEQKIMHFVNKESMMMENRPPQQQMLSQFENTARGFMNQDPSPRQMFEMVRSLGLNHDSEVANSLVFKNNDGSQGEQQQQQQQNMKAVLMKLAQGEDGNPKVAQQAEQALTNLTGQQLLSKSDASGTLQSMFFNLPMMLGGKPENLQVFVNSKNEGQQVDWENCNLYFLLETKKLGDVGILLNSTDRNLSITIKNDLPGFKQKMEPLAALTKEKLQEVGYNVSSLSFTRMTATNTVPSSQQELEAQDKPSRPVFTEKGMDFKI